MLTLGQSQHVRGHAGEPLDPVWEGITFTKGQLVLVAAGPGTGKSAFILSMALKSKTPTLYFSADSDAFTQLIRSVAIITGTKLDVAAGRLLTGQGVPNEINDYPIRFDYSGSPTLDQVDAQMLAYEEVFGVYPELVIVDNVTNIRGASDGEDDPFAGLESLMDYLHTMARATGACVVGMHHVTGPFNDADKPIPLSGVKGQISRVPEMILTLHRKTAEFGPDQLCVSTVKNRSGKADPSGYSFVELDFDGDRMSIT